MDAKSFEYNITILRSAATQAGTTNPAAATAIPNVIVKGKQQAITIYTPE